MARKPKDSILDDLLALFKVMPVWVGPGLALLTSYAFRTLPALLFPARPSGPDMGVVLRPFLASLAWFAAGVVLFVWLSAEAYKLRRRHLLNRQTGIESVRRLSWQAFEQLVAEAYRRQGYTVDVTGNSSGDGGVDVALRGHGERVLVQCKQWKKYTIGVRPVRELLGVVVSRQATRGILVTSGQFTREAQRFAENTPQIELVDGAALSNLIRTVKGGSPSYSTAPPPIPVTIESNDPPECPVCLRPMISRVARRGTNAGTRFWGCPRYPSCRGTRPV